MKPDEKEFLLAVLNLHKRRPYHGDLNKIPFTDEISEKLGMHDKRSYYLVRKWSDKGWWNSGVTLRSGWFTEKGIEALKDL